MTETEFARVLRRQKKKYPLMQPQDYAKLAYQAAFGPEHMIAEEASARAALAAEWKAMQPGGSARPPEAIGGGMCRFFLDGAECTETGIALLNRLFCLTAQNRNSGAALEPFLAQAEALPVPGMRAWLAAYRKRGCPAVHHSETFRAAYAPHYRIIKTEYANAYPVLLAIAQRMESRERVLAAIDGRCGSGKTTLARVISEVFPCSVFHMDDFYSPFAARSPGWEQIPAGNIERERFAREVLLPARRGNTVEYRAFSCEKQAYCAPVSMPVGRLAVIEGSYCQHPDFCAQYDIQVLLTISPEEQKRRLMNREGGGYAAFESTWIPLEENYLAHCRVAAPDEIRLDTSAFTHCEEKEK